ncbi:MAG: hypothetical protein IE917_07665 [Betaproteobacteria bacterium]|nr:hypothetical protein [Betaproteobacteria bacterium]
MQDDTFQAFVGFFAFAIAIAIYWFFYTNFIERLKLRHPLIYASLGSPSEMDSNLSASFNALSGFTLKLQFLKLGDKYLAFLGCGLLGSWLVFLLFFIWQIFKNG